jgi:hypothetical protein
MPPSGATSSELVFYGLQYAIYFFELSLVVYLFLRRRAKRLAIVVGYLILLLATDGVARPVMLHFFGEASVRYAYFYWLTDVVEALATFSLTWSFFRRACAREGKLWRLVRVLLLSVFAFAAAISALALTRHYARLSTVFMLEFSQNLYFSCLVLNVLLYITIQQLAIDDDELGLLVCGMGVQFAGEAAGLALFNLTSGGDLARLLLRFLYPVCTLGMLMIWSYALVRKGDEVGLTGTESELSARAFAAPAPRES